MKRSSGARVGSPHQSLQERRSADERDVVVEGELFFGRRRESWAVFCGHGSWAANFAAVEVVGSLSARRPTRWRVQTEEETGWQALGRVAVGGAVDQRARPYRESCKGWWAQPQAVKMQQEGRRARAWCTRRTSREGFAVHEREWRRAAGDQDARRVPRPVVRLHVLTHWPCALTVGSRAWLLGPK